MIRHFFLDKTNTIIENSEQNLGLNPILQIGYGAGIMRGLIHFDIAPIQSLIEDKTFAEIEKLSFRLRMVNCMSVDTLPYEKTLIRGIDTSAKRASSFDLMLVKVPVHWDGGRGFDYTTDFWIHDKRSMTTKGSNWYCSHTGVLWNGELQPPHLQYVEGGIFSPEYLASEYQKYMAGEDSAIVGTQHFDFGQENLSIDITKYVFDVMADTINDINYGLCLCFTPVYESMLTENLQYVGFFNDNTNTFFHPYVEAEYKECIMDDRESFTLGMDNRLYLYVSHEGIPVNLDNMPECKINETMYDVKQATKGVYYAQIPASGFTGQQESIESDTWSKIVLNGVEMENVEMDFNVFPTKRKFQIGSSPDLRKDFVPSIYGINNDEDVSRGEIREVTVDFRIKYMTETKALIDSAEYRLYVMDGSREYDVLDYQPVEKGFLYNFFIVYTEDLIPNEYFIDIRVRMGREVKYYKKALRFKVLSNVSERYE